MFADSPDFTEENDVDYPMVVVNFYREILKRNTV